MQFEIFINVFTFGCWCHYALTRCHIITWEWWFHVHLIFALDQIQIDACCIVVKWCFSFLCSDLNLTKCIHIYIYIYIYTKNYQNTHSHIQKKKFQVKSVITPTHTHTHTHTQRNTHTHTQRNTHTHTHTHTHTTYQISKENEEESRQGETHSKKKEGPIFIKQA